MIYIDNNTINLTRGDDASLTVNLTVDGGEPYVMDNREILTLGIRQTPEDSSPLVLQINSLPGSNVITFTHEATTDLEVGFYSADIQLTRHDGKIVTVWPKLEGSARVSNRNWKNFCLMSEVVRE